MRVMDINGERFYSYQDVSMLLFGKVNWSASCSAEWSDRAVAMFPTGQPVLKRCSMINTAGIRAICAKTENEHLVDEILNGETVDPFQISTETLVNSALRSKANDVLGAFFGDQSDDALRDAMKGLQAAMGASCNGEEGP